MKTDRAKMPDTRIVEAGTLWPVFEFRPLPNFARFGFLRYAEGRWIEDDGEHDLAFLTSNTCLYVSLPYGKNTLWSWTTGHWSSYEVGHPRGNAWHYSLRDGAKTWGEKWDRDRHPNELAGRSGMSFASAKHRCANGRHINLYLDDPHILAGLVRNRETKETLRAPEAPVCMYCGDSRGVSDALARGRAALKAGASS